jgi:hypothetical protein
MIQLTPLESKSLNEDIRKYYYTEGPFFLAKLYPHLPRSYILKRANKLGFRLKKEVKKEIYKENGLKSQATQRAKKSNSDYSPKGDIGLTDEIQILAVCKPWGWKPKKTRPKKV